jgi:hypothetical protein
MKPAVEKTMLTLIFCTLAYVGIAQTELKTSVPAE